MTWNLEKVEATDQDVVDKRSREVRSKDKIKNSKMYDKQ